MKSFFLHWKLAFIPHNHSFQPLFFNIDYSGAIGGNYKQGRFRSDCTDVQSDLILPCLHRLWGILTTSRLGRHLKLRRHHAGSKILSYWNDIMWIHVCAYEGISINISLDVFHGVSPLCWRYVVAIISMFSQAVINFKGNFLFQLV